MQKISEAVVDKVRTEAQGLISQAEKASQEEIDKAKGQRETNIEAQKHRMLTEAEEEAARIVAQGSLKGHQQLSSAKVAIVDQIINRARKTLSDVPSDRNHLLKLVNEALAALGTDKARIYVSPKDMSTARELLAADRELASKIIEVKELDCMGGVMAEDSKGKLSIDNTYNTRLEMLMPRLLPEMSKELF